MLPARSPAALRNCAVTSRRRRPSTLHREPVDSAVARFATSSTSAPSGVSRVAKSRTTERREMAWMRHLAQGSRRCRISPATPTGAHERGGRDAQVHVRGQLHQARTRPGCAARARRTAPLPSVSSRAAWTGRWRASTSPSVKVDAYGLVDLPDDETAAAVSLAVTGSGAAQTRTIRLLTTDEVDAALGKSVIDHQGSRSASRRPACSREVGVGPSCAAAGRTSNGQPRRPTPPCTPPETDRPDGPGTTSSR